MRLIGLLVLFSVAAAAQLASDGIVASVTRTVNITPDQADFTVVAGATLDTTQQQVTQIFTDAGFPSPAVVGVAAGQNSYTYPPRATARSFTRSRSRRRLPRSPRCPRNSMRCARVSRKG